MSICILFTFLLKVSLYLVLLCIAVVIGLKLWLEPIKGVCKCKAKLNGKVALVTGGSSGIGMETARYLAKKGARVVIADLVESETAIKYIKESTGNNNVEYKHLDLSKFNSIRTFAKQFNMDEERLDIMVNNAGVYGLKQKTTEDGIDIVMQINYLGPFLLTNLLLPKIIASKPSRIVIVSSMGYILSRFDPTDLAGLKKSGYWTRYANSKLCNILWAKALAKHLPNGVTANALHPGIVKTNIFKTLPQIIRNIFLDVINIVFKTPKEGAQTSLHLCVAPELENASGGFYYDCVKTDLYKFIAEDDKLIQKVWDESLKLTSN